jgi:acetoin utilization deacetylase AcuC-like enzyme/GNAT superfamily N-acetyltransferase
MLRIRRIYDDILPLNRQILHQVRTILRDRFPAVPQEEIAQIGEKLRNPFKQRFRCILITAENLRNRVLGFAMMLHEPEISFCFLDWIATEMGRSGGGVGGALYDRIRREAASLKVKGLFCECLPDDASACPDPNLLPQNIARLRFYERYGARPIIHTGYEAPVKPSDTCMPHLVYDALESDAPLSLSFTRKVVRTILERKYPERCPPEYVRKVVDSFTDDPVQLRPFRYVKPEAVQPAVLERSAEQIALVVNDRHAIHQVHERGYVEAPVRISAILRHIEPSGLFTSAAPRKFPEKHILAVHDADFVNYLRRACQDVAEDRALYPYVFPIRNKARPPKEPSVLAGYYCIDTFTPIYRHAYDAARRGVDCALTAANEILYGRRIAYALVRPPGHHAERRAFGGFCYFNNAAIAARYLSAHGRVAILDLDYHHGNGQQEIFYHSAAVLTVSIHGHPRFAYPYFSGFEDEIGAGAGEGFNLNLPLPEAVDGPRYRKALQRALQRIMTFKPDLLVVSLGLDTAKGDPTGTWSLVAKDFEANGRMVGETGLPLLVVQEGGYLTRNLGTNANRFFAGLAYAMRQWADSRHPSSEKLHGLSWRFELLAQDPPRIRELVRITGFFTAAEMNVAEELATERIKRGADSGYHFVMAEQYGRLVGYTCYGPIACTETSFDIFWIAVHPDLQGRGLGRRLLQESEKLIRAAGGTRIYVETSQRLQYASIRAFYESAGYRCESVLNDFYAPSDHKAIYCKVLT